VSGCFGAARRCGTARRCTALWPARPRRRVLATGSSAALLPLPDSSVDSLSAPEATALASDASVASLPSASTCSSRRAPRRLPCRAVSPLRALPSCLTRLAAQPQPKEPGAVTSLAHCHLHPTLQRTCVRRQARSWVQGRCPARRTRPRWCAQAQCARWAAPSPPRRCSFPPQVPAGARCT